jgi:ABC-type multidrug transport system ATPase subunit
MIEIRDLRVRFGAVRAIDGLSLDVAAGESILLAGANGAGKTTLLRALAGVLRTTAASVRIDGAPVSAAARRRIAYLPASISLYDGLTVEQATRLHARFFGRRPELEIGALRLLPRQRVGALSKGEKTLLSLSLAMAAEPEYLFIDDVIHFLDPHLRDVFVDSVLRLIGERKLTLIIASQSASEIEGLPERVLVMERGRIALDEPVEELKRRFVRVYARQAPPGLPVVYAKDWPDGREMYVYPYRPEVQPLDGVEHLSLREILRAMIGGEYDRH